MNRIDALFAHCRSEGRRVFVAFLTAGDPDLATTAQVAAIIVNTAQEVGVPLILEIGFPYTDPIADGPTIQASYTRALGRGIQVADVFRLAASLRSQSDTPLVAMASYSLVFPRGAESFIRQAQAAGLDGAVIPDLPIEESAEMEQLGRALDFAVVQLIAPTTPLERAAEVARHSTGFVYYVSVTGITGERRALPGDLVESVRRLRTQTDLPICIGFGISEPEHVAQLHDVADGVIVGSAIVRRVAQLGTPQSPGLPALAKFIRSLLIPLQS